MINFSLREIFAALGAFSFCGFLFGILYGAFSQTAECIIFWMRRGDKRSFKEYVEAVKIVPANFKGAKRELFDLFFFLFAGIFYIIVSYAYLDGIIRLYTFLVMLWFGVLGERCIRRIRGVVIYPILSALIIFYNIKSGIMRVLQAVKLFLKKQCLIIKRIVKCAFRFIKQRQLRRIEAKSVKRNRKNA